MRTIKMEPGMLNIIGRAGENLAVQARFHVVEEYVRVYGPGTFLLCLMRPEEEEPYAVQTEVDGEDLIWSVTATDTERRGYAQAELQYFSGDTLAKSVRYNCFIESSVGQPSVEPPEPWQGWVQQVLQAGAAAQEAKSEWENIRTQTETLASNEPASATYEDGVLHLGIPGGSDGEDGISPAVTVSEIPGGHRMTVTDAQGSCSFDVMDGQGGGGDHRLLTNRDAANQHPISAIDGLQSALDAKADADDIPAEVTESTVAGWGYTKNTGTYSKPSGGIPKSDLASAVQTSLGKADSALQSVPSTYRTAAAQDAIDAGKQPTISDLDTIRSGAAAGATALQPADVSDFNGTTHGLVPVRSTASSSYFLNSTGAWSSPANNKTASGAKTGTKLFLIGAASQSTSGQTTQSNVGCYIGTDNCLYSNSHKTVAAGDNVSALTNDAGYLTLATLPRYNGGVS